MSTTTANSSNGTNAGGMLHVDESSMRTNKVEQVSSLLISVAVMLALAVAMLFLLFLLSMNWKRQEKMELEVEKIAGRGENAAGFERDLEQANALHKSSPGAEA